MINSKANENFCQSLKLKSVKQIKNLQPGVLSKKSSQSSKKTQSLIAIAWRQRQNSKTDFDIQF